MNRMILIAVVVVGIATVIYATETDTDTPAETETAPETDRGKSGGKFAGRMHGKMKPGTAKRFKGKFAQNAAHVSMSCWMSTEDLRWTRNLKCLFNFV